MKPTAPAWSHRIAAHQHVVVLALISKGVRLHDARDIAQEAWVKVMEADRAGKLERIELPGLVIRQAMFLLAERRRVELRRVEVPEALGHDETAGHAPDSVAQARQQLALIAQSLEQLTPRGREVMQAFLTGPAGQAQLAAHVGLSVQRFRQVLSEVRAKLRDVLGESKS